MSVKLNEDFPAGDPGVNRVTGGLRIGDNVVWRTRSLGLYRRACIALARQGLQRGMEMIYFRFANHPAIFPLHNPEDSDPPGEPSGVTHKKMEEREEADQADPELVSLRNSIQIVQTNPERGFEDFITQIHRVISRQGEGGIYFFDSLSDLQNIYYSDRMIGSFFRLTCPYLRRLKTIAYFCLDWFVHSNHALDPIRHTTQLWIDGFLHNNNHYLQPIKTLAGGGGLFRWDVVPRVENDRVAATGISKGRARPQANSGASENSRTQADSGAVKGGASTESGAVAVRSSTEESAVRSSLGWQGVPSAAYRQIDVWDSVFLKLRELLESGKPQIKDDPEVIRLHKIVTRMILTNDPAMEALALYCMEPQDLITIWQRMVGTGFIGGKALGMLLARAILRNAKANILDYLEAHDSFYIGSDVFYTFLVDNDCWWDRQDQRDPEFFMRQNESLRERILAGTFPQDAVAAFQDLLEYFAGSPIIVRSSSLLEDNFGNAFAGKYESIFCANQGSLSDRLSEFLTAVRRIYAGTMSREALEYRRDRGVLDKDEQMALLVQRVSGVRRDGLFYPDLAGTVLSWNPYVWHHEIDPAQGMARIVIGLGTRAVEQVGDDHPWIVALGAPRRRLEAGKKHQPQQMFDCIDLTLGRFTTQNIEPGKLSPRFVHRDWRKQRLIREMGLADQGADSISIDGVISQDVHSLIPLLRESASLLTQAYGVQVELEFTAQWEEDDNLRINLLQCRPFQFRLPPGNSLSRPDVGLSDPRLILRAKGPVIGVGRSISLSHIIYVDPQGYSELEEEQRYALGREIGSVIAGLPKGHSTMLLGPGRWGTSTPAMGVPVSFREIKGAAVIAEMDWMHDGLSPELSLGTHFFHEMVEADLLFIGLRRSDTECYLNMEWFEEKIAECCGLDDHTTQKAFTCLSCVPCTKSGGSILLYADPISQEVLLYQA